MTAQSPSAEFREDELDALLRRVRPDAPGLSPELDAGILAAALPKRRRGWLWVLAPGLAAVVGLSVAGARQTPLSEPELMPARMAAASEPENGGSKVTIAPSTAISSPPRPSHSTRRMPITAVRRPRKPRAPLRHAAATARTKPAQVDEAHASPPHSLEAPAEVVYLLPVTLEPVAGPYALVTVRRTAEDFPATRAGGIAFARDDQGRLRSVELLTYTADDSAGTAVVETVSACSPTLDSDLPSDAEPAGAGDQPDQAAHHVSTERMTE